MESFSEEIIWFPMCGGSPAQIGIVKQRDLVWSWSDGVMILAKGMSHHFASSPMWLHGFR